MDIAKLLRSQWDRSGAIACTLIGGMFLLLGWIGVSGTSYLAKQLPYIISGGIGGVFFLGLGATLWISADLRDEWRKLDRIEEALLDGTLRWSGPGESPLASHGDNGHAPPRAAGGNRSEQGAEPWAPEYFDQTSETPILAEASASRVRSADKRRPRAEGSVSRMIVVARDPAVVPAQEARLTRTVARKAPSTGSRQANRASGSRVSSPSSPAKTARTRPVRAEARGKQDDAK